jgi:hypothetical protein
MADTVSVDPTAACPTASETVDAGVPNLRGRLCDLDGILVDSTAAVERCWRRWAAEFGVRLSTVLLVSQRRTSRSRPTNSPAASRIPRDSYWPRTVSALSPDCVLSSRTHPVGW